MTDDLGALSRDFKAAGFKAGAAAYGVVKKGAQNVKEDAARRISGLAHAPRYPASISYDIELRLGDGLTARIGPDKSRAQGALGNILEYGSVNNPPHPHLAPALDAEGPGFEKALGDAAERLL